MTTDCGTTRRVEGPITTDQNGVLSAPVKMCCWGEYTCAHLGVHDFHYFYCAAQDAKNKHTMPGEYAYPWRGAGRHLFGGPYPKDCPFTETCAREDDAAATNGNLPIIERDDSPPDSADDRMAQFLAERINGGKFYEPQWYTDEQRELWRGHAAAIMEFAVSLARKGI